MQKELNKMKIKRKFVDYKLFTTNNFLVAIIFFQITLLILSLIYRSIDIDDAWMGEHAYWLYKNGYVKSELMRGWYLQEVKLLIHHKFMTLQGAAFIYLFGFSVYSLKSVSILYFLLFLVTFITYTFRRRLLNKTQLLIALCLFLTFPYTLKFSFIFRPEIPQMFLGFISFIFLKESIETDKKSYINSLIAGIFGGLTIVAHLNGIAFSIAGVIMLLVYKKTRYAATFLIGAILSTSLYFYDIKNQADMSLWKYQLFNSVVGDNSSIVDLLSYFASNLSKEHMRFFHDFTIIPFSLLLIAGFVAIKKYKIQKLKDVLVVYLFLLLITIAIPFSQKSRQYILLYLPYILILLSKSIYYVYYESQCFEKTIRTRKIQYLFSFLLLFYFITSNYYNLGIILEDFTHKHEKNNRTINAFISENRDNIRIVAPIEFIFNNIEDFDRIHSERFYTTLKKRVNYFNENHFISLAYEFGNDYIILSTPYFNELGLSKLEDKEVIGNYKVIFKSNELLILKCKISYENR